jgi:hypothetical protein
MESILVEREEFASTLLPAAANMTALALGDYAKQIFRGCGERLVNPPAEASSDRQILGKSPEIDWSPGDRGTNARGPPGAKRFRY